MYYSFPFTVLGTSGLPRVPSKRPKPIRPAQNIPSEIPTISDFVRYFDKEGYFLRHGSAKPRPKATYRSEKRNMARKLRKFLK